MKSFFSSREKYLRVNYQSNLFDYASTFLSTGIIQGIGVITGVLTARILGPAGKGDLAVVFWLPSLMSLAGILALPQAIAYEVSRNPAEDNGRTAAGFWLSLGLGILEGAILYPLIPYIIGSQKHHLVYITRWFLLYLPITFSGFTLLGILQGHQAFGRYNILRVLPSIFYVGGIVSLWLLKKADVSTIVVCNLTAHLVTCIIILVSAGKSLFPRSLSICLEVGKQLLKRGLVFHLPTIAGIVLMRADMALLIHMVSAEEVGYYSVAMAIALGQIGAATSLVRVNFPKVAALQSDKSVEMLMGHFRMAQPIIIIVAFMVALASPWLIRYLFGPLFLPSLYPALVLVGALAIWGLNQILDNGVRAIGYGGPGTVANMTGLGVIISCGYILIDRFGIMGMAIAGVIAQIVVFVILVLFCRKRFFVKWSSFWGLNRKTLFLLLDRLW